MSETKSAAESKKKNNPEWLTSLLKDCESEASESRRIKLIGTKGRCAVWNISELFGCQYYGVPGQACRVLERYLSITFLNYMENISDPLERKLHVKTLKEKLPLTIACCVQLAAKMNCQKENVSARFIRVALLFKGISYSVQEIISMEAGIFRTLGYRMPLWTSVDIGELLAAELNLPTEVVEAVAVVLDVAEYYRDVIDKKVRCIAKEYPKSDAATVCSLHLAASSVAAAAVHLKYDGPDFILNLAEMTRGPPPYLMCIRDAILVAMSEMPLLDKQRLKRKQ